MRRKTLGAIIGFIVSQLLLTLTIISYHTTVTITLTQTYLSSVFKFFTFLFSWPYLIIAFIFDFLGINIFHYSFLYVISTLTYILIGWAIGHAWSKKRSKNNRNRRRAVR